MSRTKGESVLWSLTMLAALFAAYMAYTGTQNPTEYMVQQVIQVEADLQTEWVSGGLKMRVNTYLKDHNNDVALAAAAHKAKVDALLAEFPKDTE